MNIPDYVSPMLGHRVWQWDGSGLVSLNGQVWPIGKALEAECGACLMRTSGFERFFEENALRRHQAPQIGCSCGIYAAKSAEQLAGLGLRLYGIRGEVYLWGTIIEHSLGWRAQFAYPKNLVLSTYTVTRDVQEAKSRLAALTAYGADISLANGKTDIRLWTKESGYHKKGLDALHAVANRPIETALRVAIFADEEAHLKFLQNEVSVAQTAEVVMGQAKYPLSAADPIFQLLRERRVRVVLVDLNSQKLEECIRAIRVTRAAAGDVVILAIGDPLNPKFLDAIDAGADNYFDCNRVREIIEFLRMCLWLINTGGAQWSKKSATPGGWSMPPRFFPPGGSTPPMTPVCIPKQRRPRLTPGPPPPPPAVPVHSYWDISRILHCAHYRWPAHWALSTVQ